MAILRVLALTLAGLLLVPLLSSSSGGSMYRNQVAVLAYHHISDKDHSNVTITPELFRSQLTNLSDQGFHFITLEQFRRFMAGESVPDNAVLVTFDDGYESFYLKAFPILKDLDIPAVNFVVTSDLEHPKDTTIPSLSTDEIRKMTRASADYEFQCHSDRFHQLDSNQKAPLTTRIIWPNKQTESDQEYELRVETDTKMCQSRLHGLQEAAVDTYAYPFGEYNDQVSHFIKTAGIRYAFTVTSEMATQADDPLQIPRINAGNPSITPDKLESSILRRALDLETSFEYIPLRDAITNIGGTVMQNRNGITFYYRGITWQTARNATWITKDGEKIELEHELKSRQRRVYIHIDDLQKALGITINYCPNTDMFRERFTPKGEQL